MLVLSHREDNNAFASPPPAATAAAAASLGASGAGGAGEAEGECDAVLPLSPGPLTDPSRLRVVNGSEPTHAAVASLPSLSGTYTAFLRLYKLNHAGGEGAISLPPQRPEEDAVHPSREREPPAVLLQSHLLSSQSVEMATPPTTKTKPGYFFKREGERLELVVMAAGHPAPEFTWFKNGFPLQREAGERPHLLVLDKLSKVRSSLSLSSLSSSLTFSLLTLSSLFLTSTDRRRHLHVQAGQSGWGGAGWGVHRLTRGRGWRERGERRGTQVVECV